MLVLSAAVFVIVIDARDVGPWGWRAGFNTKSRRARRFFRRGLARVGGTTKDTNCTKGELVGDFGRALWCEGYGYGEGRGRMGQDGGVWKRKNPEKREVFRGLGQGG